MRRTGHDPVLLDRVRQLMSDELATRRAVRLELSFAEVNVSAHGESLCAETAGQRSGMIADMQSHGGEVSTEARLHEEPQSRRHLGAGAAGLNLGKGVGLHIRLADRAAQDGGGLRSAMNVHSAAGIGHVRDLMPNGLRLEFRGVAGAGDAQARLRLCRCRAAYRGGAGRLQSRCMQRRRTALTWIEAGTFATLTTTGQRGHCAAIAGPLHQMRAALRDLRRRGHCLTRHRCGSGRREDGGYTHASASAWLGRRSSFVYSASAADRT